MVYLVVFLAASFFLNSSVIAAQPEALPPKADQMIVMKSKRIMALLKDGEVFRTYRISLGRNPRGHKQSRGDLRTPEGEYVIDGRNSKSRYHMSLHISYPNENDIRNARGLGVEPGGNIMIHGLPNGAGWLSTLHTMLDWTLGCIAVTNEEIEEIWRLVPDGCPIRIELSTEISNVSC